MRTGTANSPQQCGAVPTRLFARMACEMTILMVDADGTQGAMRRLSNPRRFQTFGCALGFDWHSSGLTTTILRSHRARASSLHVPLATLAYTSRMSARVGTTAIQDGYLLFHHMTVFWESHRAVIPQGTNDGDLRGSSDNHNHGWTLKQLALFQEGPQTNGA